MKGLNIHIVLVKLNCAFKLCDESIPNLNYNNLSLINNIDNILVEMV